MRYTIEIDIHKPLLEVADMLDNPENLKHWQPGFVSIEHRSGDPGSEGAVSVIKYKMGSREMVMTETITRRELPQYFDAKYETNMAYNEQQNEFIAIDDQTTRWVSHCYFKLHGVMKVIGWLMPGSFKKQSRIFMENFKAFVEEGKSVADT